MASQDRRYPYWHLNHHLATGLDIEEFLPVGPEFQQQLWQAMEAELDLALGVGLKQ